MLDVRSLSKQRGGRILWDGLSFRVAAGERVAITGPSGSGKSTLLDCIGQIDSADRGSIEVCGVDGTTNRRTARLLRRDVLGYLFQDFGLVPDRTVTENIRLGVGRRRMHTSVDIVSALGRVGLSHLGDRRVHDLSGGEQQRVALARLIVKQPRLILADEPTSALDGANGQVVFDVLEEAARDGAAVVIATHSDRLAATADHVVELSEGRPTALGDHRAVGNGAGGAAEPRVRPEWGGAS